MAQASAMAPGRVKVMAPGRVKVMVSGRVKVMVSGRGSAKAKEPVWARKRASA
jgi:hypothetical protein